MPYDPFLESGWQRFLRRLAASFRLGRAFGVEVRVYWVTLVVLPLIGVLEFARLERPVGEVVVLTALMTLGLYVVVWTHEMGHIVAGRRFGIPAPLITLSPLGGVAHMSGPTPNPRAEVLVALAGPAVHLVWLAFVWPLSWWVEPWAGAPEGWWWSPHGFAVSFLLQVNVSLLVFNLLPVFPLDGGRVLRALLARRMHPNRATLWATRVGMVGGVVFVIAGILWTRVWGGILIAIGITVFLACRREMRAARHHAGPYGTEEPLAPWQSDPDAWKGGARGGFGAPVDAGEAKPGPFARWRARRRERADARRRAASVSLEAEVDRVLERVSEVGMAGLTPAERAVLERASKAKREGR